VSEKVVRFDTGSGRMKAADHPYAYQTATPLPGKELVMTGVTAAGGGVTFTLPTYFTTVHIAIPQPVRNTGDPTLACWAVVRTQGPSQVVCQVFESKTSGVLIGGVIEGAEVSPAGITVNLLVKGI
jgi:hypothetical protein